MKLARNSLLLPLAATLLAAGCSNGSPANPVPLAVGGTAITRIDAGGNVSLKKINVGWGKEVTIAELAKLIAEVAGFTGAFRFASDKPDGAPRKVLDVSRLAAMGWHPRIPLREGLRDAYQWYAEHAAEAAA